MNADSKLDNNMIQIKHKLYLKYLVFKKVFPEIFNTEKNFPNDLKFCILI